MGQAAQRSYLGNRVPGPVSMREATRQIKALPRIADLSPNHWYTFADEHVTGGGGSDITAVADRGWVTLRCRSRVRPALTGTLWRNLTGCRNTC